MSTQISFENCLAFLNWQWNATTRRPPAAPNAIHTTITLSRQAGSGAHTIAEKLAARLQAQAPKGAPPWTVFDRNLVEQVVADHHLPARLAHHMPEDRISEFDDIMDDLFGLHTPSWAFIQQTAETMLRLAGLGNVILIGRGAHIVTAKLPHVLHVRLIAPLEQRVAHLEELRGLNHKAAVSLVRREDRGRARYLKKYFKADVEDPLRYHLIINTGLVSYDAAAEIIARAVTRPPSSA